GARPSTTCGSARRCATSSTGRPCRRPSWAGWGSRPSRSRRPAPRGTFLGSTSTYETPLIAQILQGDLKKAGIDVTLTIVEPSRYFPAYFAGKFDLSLSFLTLATLDPTDFTISSAYRLNATNPAWLETGPPRGYLEAIEKLNASF